MRLHHVVPTLFTVGGPSYTVPALCTALAALGDDVVLHTLDPVPDDGSAGHTTRAYRAIPWSGLLRLSPDLRSSLRAAAGVADVIHTHGIWQHPQIAAANAATAASTLHVSSPRGMLDPWAVRHHRFRKGLVWRLGQGAALHRAACLHATAPMEYEAFRALGLNAPITVIPNGVSIPRLDGPIASSMNGRRRLLYLARIHRKKGLDRLLKAWGAVAGAAPDWEFHVAGADDGYLTEMVELSRTLHLPRVVFRGEIPEREKTRCFRESELYILPTHAENWGVSIGEALACAVPAIVGKGAPWSGLETHQCGWWIDNTVDSIVDCLRHALALSPNDLRARGLRGRAWMAEEYSWRRVGAMMRDTYRWLLHGTPQPQWVIRA